jgi:hypothetical protein
VAALFLVGPVEIDLLPLPNITFVHPVKIVAEERQSQSEAPELVESGA